MPQTYALLSSVPVAQKEFAKEAIKLSSFLLPISQRYGRASSMISTAVATRVLENLMNRTGSDGIKPDAIVPLLGENSTVYCKAYNDFTGVTVTGL